MLTQLIGPITSLLDKFIPDADEKAKLAHEIATLAERNAHENRIAQIETNREEAKHRSVFVAGWRPFIGWVCGVALAYHFIVQPMVIFIIVAMGKKVGVLPDFDMYTLVTILGGLLGLGGLRTYEKSKGITK